MKTTNSLATLLKESQKWVPNKTWDDPSNLHKRITAELNSLSNKTSINENSLLELLKEAREWITDKPWDDSTYLHKRISEALGMDISYKEYFEEETNNLNQTQRKTNFRP